jgi:hypothetical protein
LIPYYYYGIAFRKDSASKFKIILERSLLKVSPIAIGLGSYFSGFYNPIAEALNNDSGKYCTFIIAVKKSNIVVKND